MTDRDTGDRSEAQPFGQELLSYVEGLKFGTPEFRAVSDYFQEQRLEHDLGLRQDNASAEEFEAGAERHRSDVRITEMTIALLKNQIYQNKSQLEGYEHAYLRVQVALEDSLLDDADNEAVKKYPDDKEAREAYASELYHKVAGKLEDTVFRITEGDRPNE